MCSKAAEVVHHKSYDLLTMEGQRDGNLISLCHQCHESIEFMDDGNKNGIRKANLKLNQAIDKPPRGSR